MGPSKCCREVMHGKCSWNITRSQRRQEQGGWWCTKRRQKGIALGHFLKAPSNLTHSVTQSRSLCFLPRGRHTGKMVKLCSIYHLNMKVFIAVHCAPDFMYESGNKWLIFKSTQWLGSSVMPNYYNWLHMFGKNIFFQTQVFWDLLQMSMHPNTNWPANT